MKKKIFILEKDEGILEIVSYVLADEGYDIKALTTEDGIFEHIEIYSPDAILLDIVSPSEIGTEICRKLKVNAKTKHIPVIVLSTHSKITETIKEVCADDVLPKPFDIDDLINTLRTQFKT
jgi:DNA-binding response OmpR family regulator